jgi:MFS family permease
MVLQALALGLIGLGMPTAYASGLAGAVPLGAGTAMVYPALLAAAADISPGARRASTLGWYRFWRDLEYPAGAWLAGVVTASFGLVSAVYVAGILTFASGLFAAVAITPKPTQAPVPTAARQPSVLPPAAPSARHDGRAQVLPRRPPRTRRFNPGYDGTPLTNSRETRF